MDHNGIEQIIPNLLAKPAQVFRIGIVDCGAQFYLDRNNTLIGSFDDQIYFTLASLEPEVPYLGFRRLRKHPHR